MAKIGELVDPRAVSFAVEDPPQPGSCSINACLAPEKLRSGLRIWRVDGTTFHYCTSGFLVHTGTNTKMLTAGHCDYGSWYNGYSCCGPDFLGGVTEDIYYDYSDGDAELIDIVNSRESNWVYVTKTIAGYGFPVIGQSVCLVGQASQGTVCGQIQDTNDVTFYNGLHFVNQVKTSIITKAGDSGAGVYNLTQQAAYGIHASRNSTNEWYGRTDFILQDMNESLMYRLHVHKLDPTWCPAVLLVRLVCVATIVGGALGCSGPQEPTAPPTAADPSATVFASSRAGPFLVSLRLLSQPRAGVRVDLEATLAYEGPERQVTVYTSSSGPIVFSVAQVGGSIKVDPLSAGDCVSTDLQNGRPYITPFIKSGAFDPDARGPDADFYRAYFSSKDLVLPAGRWLVAATFSLAFGDCSGQSFTASAPLEMVVAP